MLLLTNMILILRYGVCFWLLFLFGGILSKPDFEAYSSARVWSTNYSGLLYSIAFCGADFIVQLGPFQLSASVEGHHIIQTNNSYFNGVLHPYNKTCATIKIYAVQGLADKPEWFLSYGTPIKIVNETFQIKNCPSYYNASKLKITNSTYTYNASGQVECSAGQELFYNNSLHYKITSVCEANATWRGVEKHECWSAPNASFSGHFFGQEGSIMSVYCNYEKPLYPIPYEYKFKINDMDSTYFINTTKIQLFNLTLTPKMHGKKIQCQVVTNYTQLRQDKGWSQQQRLNVTFKPFWIHENPLICYTSCTIIIQSNPPPFYAHLHTPENRSVDVMKNFTQDGVYYNFIFNGKALDHNVEYTLEVGNSVGNASTIFTYKIATTTTRTTTRKTITTQNQALVPVMVAGGSAVIIFVVVLIVLYLKHRRAKTDEKEVRDNPLYGTSQGVVKNSDAFDASKKNKKPKTKEVKVNVAYQSASNSPDAIEEAYGSVKTSEKEEKPNILYEAAGPSTRSDETYAQVNKKKSKIKPIKVNVAYVPTPENPDAPEEAYAVVDKTKKTKDKKQKKGKQKNDTTNTSYQPSTSKTDEYAVVIKKVKNQDSKNGESSRGATYAVVSKPKKKKEPPPEPPSDSDDDPYAEVELHGQEDKGNF